MQRSDYGDTLIQLTRWPRVLPLCHYLVREVDGLTLIDTGMSGAGVSAVQAVVAELRQPLTRIVLTHAHADHCGGLDAFAAAFPQAEVVAGARTADFLRGERTLTADEQQRSPKLKGSFKTMQTVPTRLLQPGDRLGSLLVVAAPGHSLDNLAFHDTRDGTLIAGDAFQTQGRVAVSGVLVPSFPLPGIATWHRPTALATARELLALQPTRLAVGHGPVHVTPQPAMRAAIDEAARTFGA